MQKKSLLGISKLLKSCWLCNEIKRQVCATLDLVSRKEFGTQKQIIEKLRREIAKIKSVKRKV